MLKARVIKSEHCKRCKAYFKVLNKQEYDYLILDADDDSNQDILDKWKISLMPVVQIIDIKDDGTEDVVFQFPPGPWSVRSINGKINSIEEKNK